MTHDRSEINIGGFRLKRAAIGAGGLVVLVGVLHFSGQGSTAYTCDSMVPDIVSISEANQNAIFTVKILDVVERKTISTGDARVECSGVGILSSGIKATVNYRAYVEYDKWWVYYDAPTAIQ